MKFLRFLRHDVAEGLFAFCKKYILVILFGAITCAVFDKETGHIQDLVGKWSPLGYSIHRFYGQYPFRFDINSYNRFTLPFSWVLEFLLLAYCVGEYMAEDMRGFGKNLMLKSGSRSLWWASKCVWCLCVNVVYFLLVWGVNVGYAWICMGEMKFEEGSLLYFLHYGKEAAAVPVTKYVVLAVGFPFLVGVVQSLAQMILSLYVNGAVVMAALLSVLVFSAYYSSPFLVHGYAMVIRFFDNGRPDFTPLKMRDGWIYLLGLSVFLVVLGRHLIRKKNII